jgi:hypothetical protein
MYAFSAPPVIHRDWTPPVSAKDAASSGEQLLPLLQGRRLAAELVYVLRPIIHLMVSVCKGYCHKILSSNIFIKKILFGSFLKCLAYFYFFQRLLRSLRMFLNVVGRLARKNV